MGTAMGRVTGKGGTARTLFAAAAVSVLVACGITDEDIKLPYYGFTPEATADGWEVSTPAAEGLDPAAIEQVYRRLFDQDLFPTVHSLLVVRHGRIVAEAYVRDRADRERIHHLQSATKSITSLLAGIAVDRGLIESPQVLVYDVIPEAFDDDLRKRAITLEHALTMRTGLQFDNDENTDELYYTSGSSLEFVLHRALVSEPGATFYYHDGNPQLASGMIQRVSGSSEEAFAREHLFGPLGITEYQWEHAADGLTFGAFGLWLKPRDMAKIGQMLVQAGGWNGHRIVSSEWLAEATSPHTQAGDYGYYFWLLPDGSFEAEGHGGQVIRVWRALDLTVVMTADPYSASAALSPGMYGLIDAVAAAVTVP